jgi:transcriptional regulator with XRE-family HTH domain
MAKKEKPISKPNSLRFGAWLRNLRESRNLPLRVIAAAAEMDQAHLSKVELGQRLLTSKQSIAIAEYFKIDPNEIEARRIVERFQTEHSNNPAVSYAINILHENQSSYRYKK